MSSSGASFEGSERSQSRRVLIAARLSRITEKGRSRIERDDQAAQKWATAQGDRTVVAVSEDPGVSGATNPFKRPGLGPYLTDPALMATYDEIVASTLDRLGRNARDLAHLREWAEDNGKRITLLSPPMHWPPDPGDFAAGLIWDVLARLAQIEWEQIRARYRNVRQDLQERGSLHGRPPFGFQVVGERGSKTLVPVPELVPYLRGMVERALRGDTYRSIARWLDSEGVEPRQGGRWSPGSVGNALRSTALKGRRYDANGRVLIRHEGIISSSEWSSLQAALDSRPSRRGPITAKTPFLTGSIVCGHCGGPMYLYGPPKRRKDGSVRRRLLYYRCSGTGNDPSTCRNLVPKDQVEEMVDTAFGSQDRPGYDSLFGHTKIVEQVVVPGDNHAAEVAEVEAELRALDFDDPRFDEKQKELRAERRRLKALPIAPPRVTQVTTGLRVRDVWPNLDDEAKRRYLLAAWVKVIVVKKEPAAGVVSTPGHRHYTYIFGTPARITGTLRTIQAPSGTTPGEPTPEQWAEFAENARRYLEAHSHR